MKYANGRWGLDSTGRALFGGANASIGVAEEHGELIAYVGYDGHLGPQPDFPEDDDYRKEAFTEAERAEIADHMIALWQRWKVSGR